MSAIFDTKIKQFLFNSFKTQANIESTVIKNITKGNNIYNDLITKFGNVTNMSDEEVVKVEKELKTLINIKNKISNIINTSITTLNTINSIIKIISTIITIAQIIIQILKALPIPALYMTSGIIITFSDIVAKADKKIDTLNTIIKAASPFLKKILELLQKVKSLLTTLDQIIAMIQAFLAARNKNYLKTTTIFPETHTIINIPNSNVIGSYNGFMFELKQEENPKFQVGDIKRNYAVAIDSKGVERLKSSPSFASEPSILIDELKFQIDTNNLKP